MNKLIGIGIESSCDETSIALVENGKKLLSLKLNSQISLHSPYKGVVPELASRAHLENINFLYDECLTETGLKPIQIDYIAITTRPGLLGSLMIGSQFARTLAWFTNKPLVSVDHLLAHFYVVQLENQTIEYPFLGLLLSGGNTAIFIVHSPIEMEMIANTMDDALGEAFDKVASLLELNYPGGPIIERYASEYKPSTNEKKIFPELLKDSPFNNLDFSYSGLKTSVMYYIKKHQDYKENISKICYHFQNAAFRLVERNLWRAVQKTKIKNVIAAGGVLANQTLRDRLKNLASKKKFQIQFPQKKIYCTDNGAM
ncbi:MAG: tRNA (adenosine(37)-N6)-threonylcarbamoyltransferase complex transferase subunit TsaD, partial [Leptospiraceae bacterium]|nr:tRNA (adenosine(37)-N6)-threonylcarbamoyltransferase complex transferase subunit TsaD [Leptospiraceae bacterium]